MEKKEKNQEFVLEILAEIENFDQVTAFFDEHLEALGCTGKEAIQIQVAVEEVFVNIASYAYYPGKGNTRITIWNTEDPDMIWVRFVDGGIPFDPLKKPDPDITLKAEQREVGGLGIYMVKEFMDSVSYVYENQENTLTFGKKYESMVKGTGIEHRIRGGVL